jgi:hypothetical protein
MKTAFSAANQYQPVIILSFIVVFSLLSGCVSASSTPTAVPSALPQASPTTTSTPFPPTQTPLSTATFTNLPPEASPTFVTPLTRLIEVNSTSAWSAEIDLPPYAQSVSVEYVQGAWSIDLGVLGYFGPDGYPPTNAGAAGAGCTTFPLAEAPVAALLARINEDGPFVVGTRSTFSTPAQGKLFFGINDGCAEDNDGNITLRVTTLPAVQVTPESPKPSPRFEQSFTVDASMGYWQNSGVTLEKRQTVSITHVTSAWSFNFRGGWKFFVGPQGYTDPYTSNISSTCGSLPLADAPLGALVARVGSSKPFVVGYDVSFDSGIGGPLYFRMNDDCTGDDDGQMTVSITILP